jgi:hypothetical protein
MGQMGQRVAGGVAICAVFRGHELSAAYTLSHRRRAGKAWAGFLKLLPIQNVVRRDLMIRSGAT